MKLVLHGILADRFGPEYEIQTDVVADAIEGLSRQLPEWPRDLAIDVIGYGTERLLRSKTGEEEVHLVPRMYGGGGKFTTILLGVALVALAIALPAAGGLYIAGTSIGMSTSAIMAMGVGMVILGAAQLFMKAPTIDKSSDPPASQYLGVNRNTTAIGTLVALGWGRMKVSGHWLSIQVNSNQMVTTSFPATTS